MKGGRSGCDALRRRRAERFESLADFRAEMREIVSESDVLQHDKFVALSRCTDEVVHWKRDLLFRGGEWRGESIVGATRRTVRGRVVVVGHSDLSTGPVEVLWLRMLGARLVAGSNLWATSRSALALPLGLTNDCDDSPAHRILGDVSLMQRARSDVVDEMRSSAVYVNINTRTAPRYRDEVLEAAERSPGVAVIRTPDYSREGRLEYLRELAAHEYVACPRGNGFDTHRVYEALYMGAIPVILRSRWAESLYRGLPVIFVRRWQAAFDRRELETARRRLDQMRFDSRILRSSFWEKVLSRQDLDSGHVTSTRRRNPSTAPPESGPDRT